MTVAGEITIDLVRAGACFESVEITSSRPLKLARSFRGQSMEKVFAGLPRLFNLCALAHWRSAVAAGEKAAGRLHPQDHLRDILVLAETAREHALRVCLDWPRQLGFAEDTAGLKAVIALPRRFSAQLIGSEQPQGSGDLDGLDRSALLEAIAQQEDLLAGIVFGEPLQDWLDRDDLEKLADWHGREDKIAACMIRQVLMRGWATAGAAAPCFLAELDDATLTAKMMSKGREEFIARPLQEGKACETTSLARQRGAALIQASVSSYGAGLLTRLLARLRELACIPSAMRRILEAEGPLQELQDPPEGAVGLAQVEAARGRLVHFLRLEKERIADYAILAPTEWNFHPEGAAAASLRALREEDQAGLSNQARLLVESIDPCVGYRLRMR